MGNCTKLVRKHSEKKIDSSVESDEFPLRQERTKRINNKVNQSLQNSELSDLADVVSLKPSEESRKFLQTCLESHIIFSQLYDSSISGLLKIARLFKVPRNTAIYSEGSNGICFFILQEGKVSENNQVFLYTGDIFGDFIIHGDSIRQSSSISLSECIIWEIPKKSYLQVVKSTNISRISKISYCINKIPFFEYLNDSQKESLISELEEHSIEQGTTVVNEDNFYVISEGSVQTEEEDLEAPAYISEYQSEFTAIQDVVAFSIKKKDLLHILGEKISKLVISNSIREALTKSPSLKYLNDEQANIMISRAAILKFPPKEPIEFEEIGYYVVIEGLITCGEIEHGPMSLVEDISITYYSATMTKIAFISKNNLEESLQAKIETVIQHNHIMYVLQHLKFLKSISHSDLDQLSQYVEMRQFAEETVIFEDGDESDGLYIMESGIVTIYKNGKTIRTIERMGYFGERSMFLKIPRSAQAVASTNISCWFVEAAAFMKCIDERSQIYMFKRLNLYNDEVELSDLCMCEHMSKGTHCNVFLTVDAKTKTPYALKTLSKDTIQAYHCFKMVINERAVLLKEDHPLIMSMVKTFKDKHRIYYLLELVNGRDLFEILRRLNTLSVEHSQFYTACIVLMLEHLHERKAAHRDLKPENITVDNKGYPKLIDFGISKIINGRTVTTIGTPFYMAPEVICGKPYTCSVDLWSLGIMVYEFITGVLPFGKMSSSPFDIYKEILENDIKFPQDFPTPVDTFVRTLLSIKPHGRGSASQLKHHPWLKQSDWDLIAIRKAPVPYIPPYKSIKKAVERGLKNRESIFKAIKVAEKTDTRPNCPSMRPPTNRNWDADF